ncbi:methyl-accepting chemotaxis protein [Lachnospiraceae bacterium KM106-2]|nr:methyl-accepting chemotaxis protein [Lachnospiraceae bacterium KM106-2]
MKKRHSMKTSLNAFFGICILTVFVIILRMTAVSVTNSTEKTRDSDLTQSLETNANLVTEKLERFLSITDVIANESSINDPNQKWEEKLANLNQLVAKYSKTYGIQSLGYITAEGLLRTTDDFQNDISDKQYYKDLMNSKDYVSSPSYNEKTGEQIIFFGKPIMRDGKVVAALTCSFKGDFLSSIVKGIRYRGIGTAYILNAEGTVIGSDDYEEVKSNYNLIADAKEKKELANIAAIQQKMIEGKTGLEQFNDGQEKLVAYRSIPNSSGWSVACEVPVSKLNKDIDSLIRTLTITIIVSMIVLMGLFYYQTVRLSKQLLAVKGYINQFANGDFAIAMDEKKLQTKNEFGDIYRAVDQSAHSLKEAIKSVLVNVDVLSKNAGQLDQAAADIVERTDAIANAMSESASGNTDQASSIMDITGKMEELGENINQVNEKIQEIVTISGNTDKEIKVSNSVLKELNESLEEVTVSYREFNSEVSDMTEQISNIGQITDSIKEIASQTNLLALNAAIESARAGEAGKGFAVVADEIRHLAEASEESVNRIGTIIEQVLVSGKRIADSTDVMNQKMDVQKENVETTIHAFRNITEAVSSIIPRTTAISMASSDSIKKKNEMAMLVDNVSAVSEELAATTEEVSATAEEFVATSRNVQGVSADLEKSVLELKEETSKFKIEE